MCFNVSDCFASIRFNEAEVADIAMKKRVKLPPAFLCNLNQCSIAFLDQVGFEFLFTFLIPIFEGLDEGGIVEFQTAVSVLHEMVEPDCRVLGEFSDCSQCLIVQFIRAVNELEQRTGFGDEPKSLRDGQWNLSAEIKRS